MMPEGFSLKPKLSEPFPNLPEMWKDPITGLLVPKHNGPNREYRLKLLTEAEKDPILQKDLLAACKESLLFWVNSFVWTYHQSDVDPETHKYVPAEIIDWPMITWEVQDEFFNLAQLAFKNGDDLLVKKSRYMGASWCCLEFLHWIWLFRPGTELREMSRKEGLVDGNADSLFWKHDYLNGFLPQWMRPPGMLTRGRDNRTKLHLRNELNGSTIAGEATSAVSLSGGRAAILFLDEFAKVENGQQIRSATRDVAPCRLVNSTPFGAGTEYTRWKNEGTITVFPMMFWDHPEKGRGRYLRKDDLGRYHIRSPWFDHEEGVRSPQEVAQEILAEDIESGETVFTISNVEKHIKLFARPPIARYNILLKKDIPNAKVPNYIQRKDIRCYDIRKAKNGKLHVWTNLILGRPDQSKQYIFGIDTSKGQGASESVISIKCKETGEKIARWSCANTPPYEFARVVIALALWCGGTNPRKLPFLKWEQNGPGWDLGKIIVKDFKYPFYYTQEKVGVVGSGVAKGKLKYGWQSSPQAKSELLGLYNKFLAHGGYINHDEKGLNQCKLYITYPGGGCGPAQMERESKSARLLHGDITIADALTLENDHIPKTKHEGPIAPYNSFAWRKQETMRKKLKPTGWRRVFDFTKAGSRL